MKKGRRIFLYGFAIWMVPFMTVQQNFSLRSSNLVLYDTLFLIILAIMTYLSIIFYSMGYQLLSIPKAVGLGFLWIGVSLLMDLFLFLFIAMHLTVLDYFFEIIPMLLIIPVIAALYAYYQHKKIHVARKYAYIGLCILKQNHMK